MKPKMKFEINPAAPNGKGWWICGGLFCAPWYIDWFYGDTPEAAYSAWKNAKDAGCA